MGFNTKPPTITWKVDHRKLFRNIKRGWSMQVSHNPYLMLARKHKTPIFIHLHTKGPGQAEFFIYNDYGVRVGPRRLALGHPRLLLSHAAASFRVWQSAYNMHRLQMSWWGCKLDWPRVSVHRAIKTRVGSLATRKTSFIHLAHPSGLPESSRHGWSMYS